MMICDRDRQKSSDNPPKEPHPQKKPYQKPSFRFERVDYWERIASRGDRPSPSKTLMRSSWLGGFDRH